MLIKKLLPTIGVCLCFVVFSLDALACACCAEPGAYSISVRKFNGFEIDELKKIRFETANLFLTAAGEESIRGIAPLGENYSVNGSLQNNFWKLNFKDNKGKTGALSLPLPTSVVAFAADIHDGREGAAGSPLLYKEWRFKYRVQSGTGFFQKGVAPATEYFLVLQGRGNACPQAEDFTHWRLEITGKKANYAFFGALGSSKIAAE